MMNQYAYHHGHGGAVVANTARGGLTQQPMPTQPQMNHTMNNNNNTTMMSSTMNTSPTDTSPEAQQQQPVVVVPTKITEIMGKSACVVWCPIPSHPDVIAVGQKDSGGFEDTGGGLELYDISTSSSEDGLPVLLGSIKTPARFASVAWTKYTGGDGDNEVKYPLGVLAGGMTDGTIIILDPNTILGQQCEDTGKALLGTVSTQQLNQTQSTSTITGAVSPITALQFSPLDTFHLCSGSTNGQIGIIDISNLPTLVVVEPGIRTTGGSVGGSAHTAEITAVAWNTAVAHIVATAGVDGNVTVWDMKSQKIWCELRPEQGCAVTDIKWNPSQGLHLLTASGDDRNPVLHIYDLGASTSMPLATLVGHKAGILKTSWCPHDDTLLLSCGKDNRTILWDLYSLQPIAEVPTDSVVPTTTTTTAVVPPSATTMFSQSNPSSIFGSGGGLGGSHGHGHGHGGLNEQKHMRYEVQWSPLKRGLALTCSFDKKIQIHTILSLATRTGRPPAWMKPKSFVTMGFGGTIISNYTAPAAAEDTRKFVLLQTVQETPLLVQKSQQHENEVVTQTLTDYCRTQQQIQQDGIASSSLWGFMEVMSDPNPRQKLLDYLGYNANEIAEAAATLTSATETAVEDDITNHIKELSVDSTSGMNTSTIEMVKRALVVGNFEATVECCFHAGNLADALILASLCAGGNSELWTTTQNRYFQQESIKRPYLAMVYGVVLQGQLNEYIQSSNPKEWKETLAVIATYSQPDEFSGYCTVLGDLLVQHDDGMNATYCYMCGYNIEKVLDYWRTQLEQQTGTQLQQSDPTEESLLALHEFIVIVSIYLQIADPNGNQLYTPLSIEIERYFTVYAQALANSGLLVIATKYIRGQSNESKMLRDRLYRSRESSGCYQVLGQPPEFPYQMEDIQQSRGQVFVDHSVKEEVAVVAATPAAATNGYGHAAGAAVQQQQQQHQYSGMHHDHAQSAAGQIQQQQQQQPHYTAEQQGIQSGGGGGYGSQSNLVSAGSATTADTLPPDWMALQDPNSGMVYYANQSTGETTWEKPQPLPVQVAAPTIPLSAPASVTQTDSSAGLDHSNRGGTLGATPGSAVKTSKSASLVSKYGDGFVTSASHPELADQYGNIGTSNPYTGSSRPGTARAQTDVQPPPISGSLNFDSVQLTPNQQHIMDQLMNLANQLKQVVNLNPVEKRQIAEAEKSVAILVKKLGYYHSISEESEGYITQLVASLTSRDYGTALSIQTHLANSEWRDHKDWLKGIKILVTLLSKKL